MSFWGRFGGVLIVLATLSGPAHAVEPSEILADSALEERARDLSKGLRCLVCRNQSIDDSDAELAKDLRVAVRERLVAGDSNDEVLEYVVSRYGEYVLLKPRFSINTALLYIGGPLMLLLGGFAVSRVFRRGESAGEPSVAALSDEERERLKAIGRQ